MSAPILRAKDLGFILGGGIGKAPLLCHPLSCLAATLPQAFPVGSGVARIWLFSQWHPKRAGVLASEVPGKPELLYGCTSTGVILGHGDLTKVPGRGARACECD